MKVLQKERLRMAVSTKYLLGIGVIVFLLTSCKAEKARPVQIARGAEWLSWTPSEKNRYVYGFLDGFLLARMRACNAADELFEVGQPHRLGDEQHPTDIPSGRCLASVDTYSRFNYTNSTVDFSAYAKPITEFYNKHPEYQGVPFPFLMEYLSDQKCSTADELFQMALKGKLRVIR
jgi:hypothetical protein